MLEALEHFDVVGVAGGRLRSPAQLTWGGYDLPVPDAGSRVGALSQVRPFGQVTAFGPSPAACDLLDGVLLACRRSVLLKAGVRFDPQLAFHFYDLDFCRSARAAGLSVGVWPISITHRSWGAYRSPEWLAASTLYLQKWGDPAAGALHDSKESKGEL